MSTARVFRARLGMLGKPQTINSLKTQNPEPWDVPLARAFREQNEIVFLSDSGDVVLMS